MQVPPALVRDLWVFGGLVVGMLLVALWRHRSREHALATAAYRSGLWLVAWHAAGVALRGTGVV
jgi:hypothetical protein